MPEDVEECRVRMTTIRGLAGMVAVGPDVRHKILNAATMLDAYWAQQPDTADKMLVRAELTYLIDIAETYQPPAEGSQGA